MKSTLYILILLITGFIFYNCSSGKSKPKTDLVVNNADSNSTISEAEIDTEGIFSRYDRVKKAVEKWNTAITQKDTVSLETLYADHIDYYRRPFTKRECIRSKSDWFVHHPQYEQKIDYMQIYYPDNDTTLSAFTAEFEKICMDNGKSTKVTSFLHFRKIKGEWLIVGESDLPTEFKRAKDAPASTLSKGKFSFYRGYWLDTRDHESGIGHDQVPYYTNLELEIGEKITGTAYSYSGMLRSRNNYTILEGKMENGILELVMFYTENAEIGLEELDLNEISESNKEHWRFKIINGNELFGLNKESGYCYGYSLMLE